MCIATTTKVKIKCIRAFNLSSAGIVRHYDLHWLRQCCRRVVGIRAASFWCSASKWPHSLHFIWWCCIENHGYCPMYRSSAGIGPHGSHSQCIRSDATRFATSKMQYETSLRSFARLQQPRTANQVLPQSLPTCLRIHFHCHAKSSCIQCSNGGSEASLFLSFASRGILADSVPNCGK